MTDFMSKEIKALFNKDDVSNIFRDIDLYTDEFEKLSKQMSSFTGNEFLKRRKHLILIRLDIISRIGFIKGP